MAVAKTHEVLQTFQSTIGRISQEILPSVVYIEAVIKKNKSKNKVSGSGFVVSADGYIVTNEHVVKDAQKVEVMLPGLRRKHIASVIGMDPQTDIALLKIEAAEPLPVPRFGDSDAVAIGEGVLAVGNPLGLDGTVSFGIVSAKGRNINYGSLINQFIQTDAMIDHGSSGGPLVNMKGEIIGVNSMGQGRGIGFTIPINTALSVKDQLLKDGRLHRGWLGVTVQAVGRELAAFLGEPGLSGVLVNNVLPSSPAEEAGIQTEDVITSVNGVSVATEDEKDLNNFRRVLADVPPGAEVPVVVMRSGEERILTITFGNQPRLEGEIHETEMGFSVQEITSHMRYSNRLDSTEGVLVNFVERGSIAAEAGMFPGEVIVSVNGKAVKALEDFKQMLSEITPNSRFLLKAKSGDNLRYHLIVPYLDVWSTAQGPEAVN